MQPTLVVVMGPSGSGKSLVGAALAKALGVPFLEGDFFHTSDNVAKMAAGAPLTDTDRAAWLDAIEERVSQERSPLIVLACSALTDYVQLRLRSMPVKRARFVLLETTKEVLAKRMEGREGHFMPVSLLDSQLAALRTPHDALILNASETPGKLVEQIIAALEDSAQDHCNGKSYEPH